MWALYVLATLSMCIFSFGVAGMTTVIPRLVEPEELAAANAIESVYSSTTSVGGPALGGLLIAGVGHQRRVLDRRRAPSSRRCGRSGCCRSCRPRPMPTGRACARSAEGFRFVVSKKVLLGMFLIDSNAMVFGMPSALFPALANKFGGGAGIVGLLYAAPYAGALLASLLSGWVGHVRRQGLVVAVAAAFWGVAIAAFGFAESLWLALLFLAAAGAADNVSAVLRQTILFSVTPDRMRGRLSGIEFAQVASRRRSGTSRPASSPR